MKRALILFILFFPSLAAAQGISQLQQFTSTTTPSSAITQTTWGKALKITGLTTGLCLTLDSNSLLTTTTCGAGGSFPFDAQSYGVSTSTTVAFLNGLFSTASSTFNSTFNLPALAAGGLGVNALGTVYSTPTTTFSGALSYLNGDVTIATNGVTVGMLAQAAANTVLGNPTGALGNIQAIATSSLFQNASASITGLLSSTDWSTFNTKISSTSLSGGAGISYNSSTGVITNIIAYPFLSNATSTLIAFNGGLSSASTTLTGNFVFQNATGTNATTTNLSVADQVDFDALTSALIVTGSTGILAEYAGTSCTNQFVRSLSALGAATCATVANTDLANSSLTVNGTAIYSVRQAPSPPRPLPFLATSMRGVRSTHLAPPPPPTSPSPRSFSFPTAPRNLPHLRARAPSTPPPTNSSAGTEPILASTVWTI